jgi:hypothetical protein
MFSSRVTKEITTPTDPAYVVTIRQLSGHQKARCQQAVLKKSVELITDIGGAGAFAEIQRLGGEKAVRAQADRDPGASYDHEQVLIEGILSWTAPEEKTPETIGDLEPETSDLLFYEILRLSRVAVTRADVETDEVAAKNG